MGCCGTSRTTLGGLFNSQIFFFENSDFKSHTIEEQKDYIEVTLAKKARKLDILIDHLNNDMVLLNQIEMKYYWCDKISTLGSLATLYLASLVTSSGNLNKIILEENLETIKDLKESLLEKILNNITHKDSDRKELTLILLLFLIEDEELKEFFIQNYIFQCLMTLLSKENKVEVKCAIVQILKEFYANRIIYIRIFCEGDGLLVMKELLESSNLNVIFDTLVALDLLSKEGEYRMIPVIKLLYSKDIISTLEKVIEKVKLEPNRLEDHYELRKNIESFAIMQISEIKKYSH